MLARTFLVGFALTAAAAVGAQTSATAVQKTTTTTTKPKLGASTVTHNKATKTTTASVDAKGNMASHTTKTGKTITYDCSKAGNKNKTACKNLKK